MTLTEIRPTRVDTQLLADLRTLRTVLEERGWCQGRAEDDDGRVCLLGGIAFAAQVWPAGLKSFHSTPEYVRYTAVRNALDDANTNPDVTGIGPRWNDDPARTVEDLYALIDAAIAAEEARS